jgi:O-antigen/teichoic acid export membrane protein
MVAALERGGADALRDTAREQASLMAALAIPGAVGLALVAHPLAEVMVGPALRDGAARVTPWISVSAAFAGVTTYYFHQAFTLARQTKMLLAAMAVPAIANLGLTLLLIPRFGLDGALWATAASYALGTLASWGLGRRVLALPVPWEALISAGLASALMGLVVWRLPSWGGASELLLKGGVGALVYGLAAATLDIGGLRGRALQLLAARRVRAAA